MLTDLQEFVEPSSRTTDLDRKITLRYTVAKHKI